MDRGRQAGMNGPLALPIQEIKAWCEMTGTIMRREELAVIRDMDRAYLVATAKPTKADFRQREMAPDVNAEAFDAVFS